MDDEPAQIASDADAESPWTTNFYPREGDSLGFDRLLFFSDAVFAIALTLIAVEIGIPEIDDPDSVADLWAAISAKGPAVLAYVVTFTWVAIYWRANHRFATTLRGVSGRFIAATLVFLGLIALLPLPAAVLGEYPDNPAAITLFALYVSVISTMEVVLFVVADRDDLFLRPVTYAFRKQSIIGGLSPLPGFFLSIPLAFVSPTMAIICWFVMSAVMGWAVSMWVPAKAP